MEDPVLKFKFGWVLLFFTFLMIFVNVSIMVIKNLNELKRRIARKCNIRSQIKQRKY